MKIGDLEPFVFGSISSKITGRATINFNKGYHIVIDTKRRTIPSRNLLIFFIRKGEDAYCSGVNLTELIYDSVSRKGNSAVAKETKKLKSAREKDGAIITFKVRVCVKNLPNPPAKKESIERPVTMRAADFYQTNQQYRKIYADLQEQIKYLQSRVGKISYNVPHAQDTSIYTSNISTTDYGATSSSSAAATTTTKHLRRTKPAVDMSFDEQQNSRNKQPNIFDSSQNSGSSDDINDDLNYYDSDNSNLLLGEDDDDVMGGYSEMSGSNSSISMGSSSNSSDIEPKKKDKKKKKHSFSDDGDIDSISYGSNEFDSINVSSKSSTKRKRETINDDFDSTSSSLPDDPSSISDSFDESDIKKDTTNDIVFSSDTFSD